MQIWSRWSIGESFSLRLIFLTYLLTFSLERTKSREGESLEYLKNVVISYLTATDQQASQKVYLLTAIAAVLKFDREELKLVGLGAELGTTNKHMGKKK